MSKTRASKEGIPLPEWIQRARYSLSEDYYTECAVEVALQLTNQLCMVAGANKNAPVSSQNGSANRSSPPLNRKEAGSMQPSSLPLIKIEHVTPENVIIYCDALGESLAATEVHVKPGHSNLSDDLPLLMQQDLCFALGKILFDIFSEGASFRLFLDDSAFISDDNRWHDDDAVGSLFSDFLLEDLDVNSVTSRQSKKSHRRNKISSPDSLPTTETSSAAKFIKSKVYLEEQGLPRSICRLVSDLLQAGEGIRFVSKTALLSLDDVQFDMAQMKTHPHLFLRDNTCPITALRLTSLFGETDGDIYGREEEMNMLMDIAKRVYLHAPPPSRISANGGPRQIQQGDNFLREVILLSGYSGSGKTSILKHLTSFFYANDMFVLTCKFDRQSAPLLMLVQSVDTFLARFVNRGAVQREPDIQYAFDRISRCIISSIDKESFVQLCELFPNFCQLFPMSFDYVHDRKTRSGTIDDPSFERTDPSTLSLLAPGGLGSGSNRVKYLFSLILKAICSGGYPVSYIFEDLQWADSISMEVIGDIIQPDGYSSTFSSEEELSNKGLLILGSFRKNEIDESMLINQLKTTDQISSNINFSTIYVDELPEQEINNMLSSKFCLPMRYTRGLAQIVHQKSRGHPLHLIEFLRFIINNKMMSYSVKDRRWIWDEITIDLQMISEGVVELLTRKLRQLPHDLIETLKVVACIGQINVATIELLDLGQFVPDMLEALESATKEGIVERAGPIFAFTHDLLQESTLNLIPEYEKLLLRKQIGKSLVQVPDVANYAGLCTLAVDQINMCKDIDGMMDPVERALFAQLNLAAGKHAIAASSYERGRGYFEAGISLLHPNPWDEQYSLCLELFEMSAVVSFMDGKIETVSARLDSILSNAHSYDDTLNSRALRTMFLASQGQYVEAIKECFGVLFNLGEELPGDISLSCLKSEINATQSLLKNTTKDTILNLPPMTDMRKLNTMKFMLLFLCIGFYSSPMLMALYCCRTVKLTLEFGLCAETIPSLAYASYALFHYGEDIKLATRLVRIAESLISGHPNEHTLRSQLSNAICSITSFVEPSQALTERSLNGYKSAQIVGDVDRAMLSSLVYCLTYIYCIPDLVGAQRKMDYFVQQSVKHRRMAILHSLMCLSDIFTALMGCTIDVGEEMMHNEELLHIAEKTNNSFLMQQIIVGQMYIACYFRNYCTVVDFGEKYRMLSPKMGVRRALDVFRVFFEGIAALCLARSTNDSKWTEIGAESVKTMTQLVECSEWNFRNKVHLLDAELHYLESRNSLAEISFKAAIVSAHEHRFYHEEALACELYGVFLIETNNLATGIEQLQLAIDKYVQWGAEKKADDVKDFIVLSRASAFQLRNNASET